MARLTKTFEIEGRDKNFEVRELKMSEIIGLMSDESMNDLSLKGVWNVFNEKFLPMCSNIKPKELEDMTPSEIEIVWEKFKEVNKSFFALAQKLGQDKMLAEVVENFKGMVLENYLRSVANLSRPVTQESLTTDIPSL